MLTDAVRLKVFAPQGRVPVTVHGGWVAVSQPLGQVLDALAGIGRKKLEKADGVLLILNVGECSGGHCLARQFPIEGFSLLILRLGGSCSSSSLLILVGMDGEA